MSEKIITTDRFDIWHHVIIRSEDMGGCPREVFTAWFHSEDVSAPACVVAINPMGNYVEWVYTHDLFRRQGIATEVLRAIEREFGELDMDGATEAGERFCESYYLEAQQ